MSMRISRINVLPKVSSVIFLVEVVTGIFPVAANMPPEVTSPLIAIIQQVVFIAAPIRYVLDWFRLII